MLFFFCEKKCNKNFKIAIIKQLFSSVDPLRKCQIKNIYKIKYFCYVISGILTP